MGLCHPERVSRSPERSEGEGSLVCLRPADLLHVTLPIYGESPVLPPYHQHAESGRIKEHDFLSVMRSTSDYLLWLKNGGVSTFTNCNYILFMLKENQYEESYRFRVRVIGRRHGKPWVDVPIWEPGAGADRKSTRLNSSHIPFSRMPSS